MIAGENLRDEISKCFGVFEVPLQDHCLIPLNFA